MFERYPELTTFIYFVQLTIGNHSLSVQELAQSIVLAATLNDNEHLLVTL